jgi:osmotically-inducible protein OsmY
MLKKSLLLFLALVTVGGAFFSYSKFYARKDITQMLNEARLNASIKTALALNRHMKGTEINVSVEDGTVELSGAVGTEIQKQLAGEIALSIKGAKAVQNGLTIKRILSRKSDENERTLGEKLDDLTVEASVKTALTLNENIRARRINVKCFRGAVTLDGSVYSVAESELAAKIADDVEGVASVDNRLKLNDDDETSDGTGAEKVDDARIEAQVRDALTVNRNIDSTEIEVASRGGIVTLTGLVHTGAEKDLVQKITEECRGVKGVVNEMRVRQGPNG